MIKYIEGNLDVVVNSDRTVTVTLPTNTTLPDKKFWYQNAIWSHNGRILKPVTIKATENLQANIAKLEASGFTKCHKPYARKSTSLKYGLCTTGVETFDYL